jgi:hypothetical protein
MKHDEKTTLIIELSMREVKKITEIVAKMTTPTGEDDRDFLKLCQILRDFYESYGLDDYKEEE